MTISLVMVSFRLSVKVLHTVRIAKRDTVRSGLKFYVWCFPGCDARIGRGPF